MDRSQRKAPVAKKTPATTTPKPKKTPKPKEPKPKVQKKTARPAPSDQAWTRPAKRAKISEPNADDESMDLEGTDSVALPSVSPYHEEDIAHDQQEDNIISPERDADELDLNEVDDDSGSDGDFEDDHPVDYHWFEYNHPNFNSRTQPPYALYNMEQNSSMSLPSAPILGSQRLPEADIQSDRTIDRDTSMCLRMEQLLLRQQELIYHQQSELFKLQAMYKASKSLHRPTVSQVGMHHHNFRHQYARAVADESRVPSRYLPPASPQQPVEDGSVIGV
jgi:hypothetical protein